MAQERFADVVERFASGYPEAGVAPEVLKQWQDELDRGFKRMTNLAQMVQHPVEPRTGQTPREEIYRNLTPLQRVQVARSNKRPLSADYFSTVFTDFIDDL